MRYLRRNDHTLGFAGFENCARVSRLTGSSTPIFTPWTYVALRIPSNYVILPLPLFSWYHVRCPAHRLRRSGFEIGGSDVSIVFFVVVLMMIGAFTPKVHRIDVMEWSRSA